MKLFLITLLFLSSISITMAKKLSRRDERGVFSGRVSKINNKARLVRIKIDFNNIRFLNKKDRLEIWLEHNTNRRCLAVVEGKSNSYLLLKVPEIVKCNKQVPFTSGSYVRMYSKDLISNLKVADELNGLLIKKRVAIDSKLKKTQIELDTYIEKVEAVNKRYQVLREKLELEWQRELTALEEDKATLIRNYNDLKIRLGDVDHKMEQYHIEDTNLKYDRWALDPKLFLRK